jgi:Flp pilus assembly protein TadD
VSSRHHLNDSSLKSGIHAPLTVAQIADFLIQSDSEDGRALESSGLALNEAGDLSRCRVVLEMAQMLVPLSASAELALAECYVVTKDADLAVGLLNHVARSASANSPTLLRAASLFKELGSFREAWLACREAVRKSPDDAQAWFDLSASMGRVGFPFSKIELVVQKAIDLEPDNVVFRISLAAALAKLGREQHAYAVVRRFGAKELEQICCSSCLKNLRTLYEQADDWRGVCLCNEQLVQRSITDASDCCGESEE